MLRSPNIGYYPGQRLDTILLQLSPARLSVRLGGGGATFGEAGTDTGGGQTCPGRHRRSVRADNHGRGRRRQWRRRTGQALVGGTCQPLEQSSIGGGVGSQPDTMMSEARRSSNFPSGSPGRAGEQRAGGKKRDRRLAMCGRPARDVSGLVPRTVSILIGKPRAAVGGASALWPPPRGRQECRMRPSYSSPLRAPKAASSTGIASSISSAVWRRRLLFRRPRRSASSRQCTARARSRSIWT